MDSASSGNFSSAAGPAVSDRFKGPAAPAASPKPTEKKGEGGKGEGTNRADEPRPGVDIPKWFQPAGLVAILLLAAGFYQTFHALVLAWWNNDNYSHGFFVLPLSIFLVWHRRDDLLRTPMQSSWFGLPLLTAGVLLQVIGIRGDVTIFQGWAFVLTVAGLVWTWFGARILRRVAFPIVFLLFMVPALPIFMNGVSFRLKEVAADYSVKLSQAMGAAVVQRGMDLYFPSGQLTVENACSGMSYLIALMALGAIFGYFGKGSWWQRLLLFASALPIAVVVNVARITSICLVAAIIDTETASGLFHDVGGLVMLVPALGLLFLAQRLLRC